MLPKWHILLGALCSSILYFLGPFTLTESTIIFLASFLIDADHYLYYVQRMRDRNLRRAIRWFYTLRTTMITSTKEKNYAYEQPLYILHWWILIILLYLLGLLIPLFTLIALGFTIHLLLDFIEILYTPQFGYSKFFLLTTWQKNKNKQSILLR